MATQNTIKLAAALTREKIGAELSDDEKIVLELHRSLETRIEKDRPGVKAEIANILRKEKPEIPEESIPIAVSVILADIGKELRYFQLAELKGVVLSKAAGVMLLFTDSETIGSTLARVVGKYYYAKSGAKTGWRSFRSTLNKIKAEVEGADPTPSTKKSVKAELRAILDEKKKEENNG